MALQYRTPRAEELERAQALVVSCINDLTQRHGFGPMASVRPPQFQQFSLRDDPSGLWVAEDGGDILGFAFSWVCGELWFLAELFVAPGQQGRGIGSELLQRTLDHADNAGASCKALITFTFNTVSQGLYIRHGLLPRTPIYNVSATREQLRAGALGAPFRTEPLQASASHLRILARIDGGALGVARDKHHRFLLADAALRGVLLYDDSDCMGYAYLNAFGHIGPLAVTRRGALGRAFQTALGLAAQGDATQVSAFIPATGEAALCAAIEQGMRITFPMLLMSSRDFGDWGCYLPRNAGFM